MVGAWSENGRSMVGAWSDHGRSDRVGGWSDGVGGVGGWSGWLGPWCWSEVVGGGRRVGGSEWSDGQRWSEMVGGSEMVRQVVVICQTSSESPWVHLSNHTQIKVAGTKELNLSWQPALC